MSTQGCSRFLQTSLVKNARDEINRPTEESDVYAMVTLKWKKEHDLSLVRENVNNILIWLQCDFELNFVPFNLFLNSIQPDERAFLI